MKPGIPCAIYTRKSSEEGLEQDFNSLHAQREACHAYVQSQKGEGWKPLSTHYDDGGFSGGNMDRPALRHLLEDIAAGKVKIVVVYKVDRLTRSLADFAKLVEAFDAQGVSFVSVTQQFNTTTSMGRLTLNVLLSFAQFEREVTGERIRDKIAASKAKGMWMGGYVPMGYRAHERSLVIDDAQADRIRYIFHRYLELGSVRHLKEELDRQRWTTPMSEGNDRRATGGNRYYISTTINGKRSPRNEGLRLPAQDVEETVFQCIRNYLNDTSQLLADHAQCEARVLQGLTNKAKALLNMLQQETADRLHLVDTLVHRVIVTTTQLTVELKPDALIEGGVGEPIAISQPVNFRRSGFGIRLVIAGAGASEDHRVDPRLVKLVRRGRTWFHRLALEGLSPKAIAEEDGCSATLVQQMLYLAFLAPDIVERIEAGTQPIGLTSKVLFRALPLPQCWDAQRQELGFT